MGPGRVELRETLEVGPEQELIIQPGTIVQLGKAVSIISKGVLKAEGTEENPVILERLEPEKAWGSLVIQGTASGGSAIHFADISGGSLTDHSGVSYSGMISIHWSSGVSIKNTRIASNTLSDDTIHIVHSQVEMDSVNLEGCYGDCVDFDFSTGSIRDVSVKQAGNDGIDFMTSKVTLKDVQIDGVLDKGLSCGELSNIFASQLTVEKANVGIAVKDKSLMTLNQGELSHNSIGIDLFQKKPMYGGPGEIHVSNTRFHENGIDLKTEKQAIAIFDKQPIPSKRSGAGVVKQGET